MADDMATSVSKVVDATDPTTDDPFVDLGLVDTARGVAPGGWRRAVVGVGVGLLAGMLVATAHRGDERATPGRRARVLPGTSGGRGR